MTNDQPDTDRMRGELLAAIEPNVPFDGWSAPAFDLAVSAVGMDPGLARVVCPRGAVDLAVEYHRRADETAEAEIRKADWSDKRMREKVAAAVRLRLDLADPELVRRATTVFALPQNATTGAKLVWETADMIWRALGDNSGDVNWYSKRATLAAAFSATVLFWMGDDSEDHRASWEFLDHRLEDALALGKAGGKLMSLPGAEALFGWIRAPGEAQLPGRVHRHPSENSPQEKA